MERRQVTLTVAATYVVTASSLTTLGAPDGAVAALTLPVSVVAFAPYLDLLDLVVRTAPELWGWTRIVGLAVIAVLNALLLGSAAREVGRAVRPLTGRALTGRALTGRALTGRALTGRALTPRAARHRAGRHRAVRIGFRRASALR